MQPLGDDAWMDKISALFGKDLRPKERGSKEGNEVYLVNCHRNSAAVDGLSSGVVVFMVLFFIPFFVNVFLLIQWRT